MLDEWLSSVPEEYRESTCQSDQVHREILAARREEVGEDDDSPDGGSSTESPTRAG